MRLSNNPSFIAAAATHQIGHTLGLQHQSVYDSYGIMISELSGGENNIFSNQAPLMGIPFYKQADWKNGHPSTGAQNVQSDTASIAGAPNNIGYRKTSEEAVSGENTVKIERQDPDYLALISSGNYSYRLFDISGRLLTQGILKPGLMKSVPVLHLQGFLCCSGRVVSDLDHKRSFINNIYFFH